MCVSILHSVIEGKRELVALIQKYRFFVITCLIFLTTSCSTITTVSPNGDQETRTVDEFKVYAENVFRRQNQASSKLIMLLIDNETSDLENYNSLVEAEERILDACWPLNNIVVMKIENQPIDLSTQYKVMNTISDCDYITRDVEEFLRNYKM